LDRSIKACQASPLPDGEIYRELAAAYFLKADLSTKYADRLVPIPSDAKTSYLPVYLEQKRTDDALRPFWYKQTDLNWGELPHGHGLWVKNMLGPLTGLGYYYKIRDLKTALAQFQRASYFNDSP
jgi:hypothetical protein